MRFLTCCLAAGLILLAAVARADAAPPLVAKIVVKYDGSIFFDGKPIKLAELGPRLNEIKARHGTIWYFRENAEAPDSPPTGLAVISAILSRHVPVQMCLSADFSEYIGADGKAHLRDK